MARLSMRTLLLLLNVILVITQLTTTHENHASPETGLSKDTDPALTTTQNPSPTEKHQEQFETMAFLARIFTKYGTGDTIPFEGFEHLLANLGLGNVTITDHDIHDHVTSDEKFAEFHDHHDHPYVEHEGSKEKNGTKDDSIKDYARQLRKKERRERKGGSKRKHKSDREKRFVLEYTNEPVNKCFGPRELLQTFAISSNKGIDRYNFLHVCPAIVYQLDERTCHSNRALLRQLEECHALFHEEHQHAETKPEQTQIEEHSEHEGTTHVTTTTWLASLLAVSIISIVGFACVGVIPLLQRLPVPVYRSLLQGLVAMAVGTLTGDALLHLIPHAMVPHDESSHSHDKDVSNQDGHNHSVYIGLCVLAGLYVFFIMERLVGVIGKCRAKTEDVSLKDEQSTSSNEDTNSEYYVGLKLASHSDDKNLALPVESERLVSHRGNDSVDINMNSHNNKSNNTKLDQTNDNASIERVPIDNNNDQSHTSHRNSHVSHGIHDHSHGTHDQSHGSHGNSYGSHGHSHGSHGSHDHSHGSHGHSHEVPRDVSSIVWMVIMGDGFHNFCDGLAIGAAFASSITGGFSTSVAVFFHELPHEIGDFAVLLNAGMPTKQALFYNVVSSVLCFIGLVLGILIGNFSAATPIIFAITGGMFIYISLADMLPELTQFSRESRNGRDSCVSIIMQCAGITAGLFIMLIIALYEDSLAHLLGSG